MSTLKTTNPILAIRETISRIGLSLDPIGRQREMLRIATAWQSEGVNIPTATLISELPLISSSILDADHFHHPRVVGLVVDLNKNLGLVVPLSVKRTHSKQWSISPTLPFTAERIQSLLCKLAYHAFDAHSLSIELETTSYEIKDELSRHSQGPSMDVAVLLAIVDALNNHELPIFEAACVMVQENNGKFQSVGGSKQKLQGFQREFSSGSLLVCHPDDSIALEFRDSFQHCWEVSTLAELAGYLVNESDALQPLIRDTSATICVDKLSRAIARIESLSWVEHDYERALQLGGRISELCDDDVRATGIFRDLLYLIEDLNRHTGRSIEAVKSSESRLEFLKSSIGTASTEDVIIATINLAAALYDTHDFRRANKLLTACLPQLHDSPQHFSVSTRYKFLNTLGRICIRLGDSSGLEHISESIDIQERITPELAHRSRAYLVEGLLKFNQLDIAEREIDLIESDTFVSQVAYPYIKFYQADLARRQGKSFMDKQMEIDTDPPRFEFGFYHQAVARQQNCSNTDRMNRLKLAEKFLSPPHAGSTGQNILTLLSCFARLGYEVTSDDYESQVITLGEIRRFLTQPGFKAAFSHYSAHIGEPIDRMTWTQFENMMETVPFF